MIWTVLTIPSYVWLIVILNYDNPNVNLNFPLPKVSTPKSYLEMPLPVSYLLRFILPLLGSAPPILQNVTLHVHDLMCSCIRAVQVSIPRFVFTAVHYKPLHLLPELLKCVFSILSVHIISHSSPPIIDSSMLIFLEKKSLCLLLKLLMQFGLALNLLAFFSNS